MEGKFDALSLYDILSLQEKCPAFELGCPFKTLVNVNVDNDFVKALKRCPEFQDHCPFKDLTNLAEIYEKLSQIPNPQSPSKHLFDMLLAMHGVSEPLEQSLGNCPVFSQATGCPFKTVKSGGVSLVDPVEKVSLQEKMMNDLTKFPISNVKQKCPAFQETCPYAKLVVEDFKKCPEFTDGCPFKTTKNVGEVYDLLSSIPAPHSPEKNLLDAFKKIHAVSTNETSVLGNCPIFHDDDGKPFCPFKSIRSEGKHLVEPVNDVIRKQH